jgi:hypothetical protein
MSAVFVTPQGDWKLGGMELLASKETNYEELVGAAGACVASLDACVNMFGCLG